MLGESVQFDPAQSRTSTSDQPVPPGGVTRALRQTAEISGMDAVAELYNEALRFATEGHFRLARERLHVLLALAPEDGEARLLLAKVLVAGQRWTEALAALDEAAAHGQNVPSRLRNAVEEHLRADRAAEDEQRAARVAREQGEIKALRQEARRLRSENAQLVGRTRDLEKETRKWAWTTAVVAAVAIVFVLGNLLFGGSSEPAPDEIAAAVNRHVSGPTEVVVGAPAPAPVAPSPVALADRASAALRGVDGLAGTALTLELRGDTAVLEGTVQKHAQVQAAERALLRVDGVAEVDRDNVEITARTRGTTHTVVSGDNLSVIAFEYYGESTQNPKILKANHSMLKGRPNLQVGQVLTIPPVE